MQIYDDFFDKYCGLVDPIYIVGYLYIKRNYKPMLLIGDCCIGLGIKAQTFRNILRFWHEQGVFDYNIDEKGGKVFIKYNAGRRVSPQAEIKVDTKAVLKEPEFSKIIANIEQEFTMQLPDYEKVAIVYKKYEYTEETFDVLIDYAKSHGAKHVGYLIKMADKLYEAGVRHPGAAIAYFDGSWNDILRLKKSICGSSPVADPEIEMYRQWKEEYTQDMIEKAFWITKQKGIPRPSFSYVNAVLKNMKKDQS